MAAREFEGILRRDRPAQPRRSKRGIDAALAAVVTSTLLACAGGLTAPPPEPADVIFYGDAIYTVDPDNPDAEAVAVRGEEIVAVGRRRDVARFEGASTRIIELGDRALVPGFIDTHGHFSMVMQMLDLLNASSPPVGPMESIDQIVEAIRVRIAEQQIPPGQIVLGYGYDDSLLAENRHPTRDDLDRASTEHPIVLLHVSAHLVTSNSAALALFGFDSDTPDPYGGKIRRRPGTREPNGVLEETAAHMGLAPVMAAAAKTPPEVFARNVHRAAAYHAAYGITTVQDGASSVAAARGLRAVGQAKALPIDVAVFPVLAWGNDDSSDLEALEYSPEYVNGVRVAGVKFVLDGSPQGRTAWMTRPYDEGPPGAPADYVAYPMMDPETYLAEANRMIDAGIPILAHANGDAAIDLMIRGVEEALDGETRDHRSVTIHAQLTREDQLDDMQRLGIVPSFFAAHPYFWGDWHRLSFGDDRALRISPLRSSLDRGLAFTIHNDAPVVPADIMRLMEIAVTRKTRSGFVLGDAERIEFADALHAVTLGAAYQYFEEDRKGSIEVGKRADLVVLARDPAAGSPDMISEIGIVETFARGASVYAATAE
jgi:predicted amidohydrolase YtcJ